MGMSSRPLKRLERSVYPLKVDSLNRRVSRLEECMGKEVAPELSNLDDRGIVLLKRVQALEDRFDRMSKYVLEKESGIKTGEAEDGRSVLSELQDSLQQLRNVVKEFSPEEHYEGEDDDVPF